MAQLEENKFQWAEDIRFLATIGVIVLHVSAPGLYGNISTPEWMGLNVIDSVVRCCVPLFVMLSGALLLQKDRPLWTFYQNRLTRIVIPFLFWALTYCLVSFCKSFLHTGWDNAKQLAIDMLKDIFIYDGIFKHKAYHLWYVYMIMGLFIITPILRYWIKKVSKTGLTISLVIWYGLFYTYYYLGETFFPFFKLPIFVEYIGYYLLGYLIGNMSFEKLNTKIIFFCLFCFGGITAFGTYFLSSQCGHLDQTFYGYLSPNVVIFSITVFIGIKKTYITNTKLNDTIRFVTKFSFGIFLIHPLILQSLKEIGISSMLIHPLVGIPVTVSLCFFISLSFIFMLHKIPGGKYLAG
jgi:surface polysaccharide O-acyltransferase-like enzyme